MKKKSSQQEEAAIPPLLVVYGADGHEVGLSVLISGKSQCGLPAVKMFGSAPVPSIWQPNFFNAFLIDNLVAGDYTLRLTLVGPNHMVEEVKLKAEKDPHVSRCNSSMLFEVTAEVNEQDCLDFSLRIKDERNYFYSYAAA